MADDRPPNGDSPSDDGTSDLKRPKRPAPTLDLSATEIPRVSEPSEPVPPVDEPPADDLKPDPRRDRKPSPILIPALAGAAAASLVMILISLAGWPVGTPTQDVTPAAPASTLVFDDLAARLARVEARPVSQPAAGPVAPSLAPRIDALDKTVAALRDDVAATRTRSEQALAAISELKAAPPVVTTAAPPDLSAITSRLTQIEGAIKTQADAATRQAAKPADDAPLRRVVAASLLDMQVRQNQPYAAALKVAASGADAARTKALETFAATGVPTTATLGNELLTFLPKLTPRPAAPATTTGTGIMDRLQAGAARLVKIERSDASGESDAAIVTRAADAAKRNDGVAARRELATLSPADKAIVQPWIDRADARDAALAASQQLATDAMTALAKPLP